MYQSSGGEHSVMQTRVYVRRVLTSLFLNLRPFDIKMTDIIYRSGLRRVDVRGTLALQ